MFLKKKMARCIHWKNNNRWIELILCLGLGVAKWIWI